MKPVQPLASGILAWLLVSCASLPDVTLGYYLAETFITVKAVRTVMCDDKNNPIVATSATPTVVHAADRRNRVSVSFADLKGPFSDSDMKLNFYDDGRLKDINASSTGEGEAILKTITSILVPVFALDGGPKPRPAECKLIKDFGGGKPLSLTYEGKVDPKLPPTQAQPISADPLSLYYATQIVDAIGGVCAFVQRVVPQDPPVQYTKRADDHALKVRQPALAHIAVTAGLIDGCKDAKPAWEGDVQVAQAGTDYWLPIPAPVVFGKEVFAASFSEAGTLTSLQYTSNTGVGQALNVANASLPLLGVESTAQRANDLKAQADLIQQQQRLVLCMADPKNCK